MTGAASTTPVGTAVIYSESVSYSVSAPLSMSATAFASLAPGGPRNCSLQLGHSIVPLDRGSVSHGRRLIDEIVVVSNGVGKLDGIVTATWGQAILFRSSTRCPRRTCIAVSIRSYIGF